MRKGVCSLLLVAAVAVACRPAMADVFQFSTGNPDDKIATGSGPGPASGVNQETESADDFITTNHTFINSGTFTGLLPRGVNPNTDVSQVRVEIYRIFPKDSTTPPSGHVPSRVNSPSDVEFEDRDSAASNLTFTPTLLNPVFTALNSVDTGIHPIPNQTTGGEGSVSGQEVQFDVYFTTPFDLSADHYFFIPQVLLTNANDHFLWLSAPKPIVAPGTPITPDLQTWIRNADLDPDWLRVGTDVIGGSPAPTFNAAFSLSGTIVPEPSSLALLGMELMGAGVFLRRLRFRRA